MTWAEHSKRRLYTDNILQDSAAFFQQWLLRTITNIEDHRLKFLEKDQTNRIVEERELRQAVIAGDEEFRVGRLYLPDNHVNYPAYWKCKLMDEQALAVRRNLPSLMITITMNAWCEELGRIGLDIQNRAGFFPVAEEPRVFDRQDITDRVFNQFSNDIMKDLTSNSEE